MEGGELGERKNTCCKNSLEFISTFASKRKMPIGKYSPSNLLHSCQLHNLFKYNQ